MFYSPNMLKTFEQCPKKYFFRFVKNITMPINDEIFESGKNIHALASYYLKKENIYKMELALNNNEKLIWEYLKNLEYLSYNLIGAEYSLNVKIGDYVFGGRIDALLKNKDKFYILDYKTGTIPKNIRYNYQTMIYLLAVARFFNSSNVVFIYLDLKNKKEVRVELTESLILDYEKSLLEVADKIEKNDFNFNLSSCPCEYDIICYH